MFSVMVRQDLYCYHSKVPNEVTAVWLAARVEGRSARAIAAGVAALIRHGELHAGDKLPTVRDLAGELGISPATVSEAWSVLRRRRAVSGTGRNGTWVAGLPSAPRPRRFDRIGSFGERLTLDLTLAGPDPQLLPDLHEAFDAGLRTERLNDYERTAITPALREAVLPTWPFDPQSLLAVNGGFEGLLLLLQTTVLPGDHVAVETPTTLRLLDILEVLGAQAVPVECDGGGPLPQSLAHALSTRPVAFVYQPRGQSPTGSFTDPVRAGELAGVLAASQALVIEDDGLADVSTQPLHSLGRRLPERTVLVRSYSKTHGPDLRAAVVGGAAEAVERARAYRTFGAGWTSRIVQDALAWLLQDPSTQAIVSSAREEYAARRVRMGESLARAGISTANRDGLSLWVPVADERSALVTLAARGIAVTPGDRFWVAGGAPHVRVATSQPIVDAELVAEALVEAAQEHGDL
jgi:DNA-binding transcriptional MocR family regulator